MIYTKVKLNDQVELKVDLYDEDIYTQCPSCGREFHVELDALYKSGGDLSSALYCRNCYLKNGIEKHWGDRHATTQS